MEEKGREKTEVALVMERRGEKTEEVKVIGRMGEKAEIAIAMEGGERRLR